MRALRHGRVLPGVQGDGLILPHPCRCPCITEGWVGSYCDVPVEHTCVNQCNGRGHCNFGFCHCLPGWYGHDCAQSRKGTVIGPGALLTSRDPHIVLL